jgi:hypothetical protein
VSRIDADGFSAADDVPIGFAPVDRAVVRWHVAFYAPAVDAQPLAQHTAEWLADPAGIDRELFANGELTVFLAGYHRYYGARVTELPPGTDVTCVVSCIGIEIVRVTRRTADVEASQR